MSTLDGSKLKKSTGNAVINLCPPPEISDIIQRIRTKCINGPICGPHISFVDPFVHVQRYPQAADLLREALKELQPCRIRLAKFNFFAFKSSSIVWLDPEIDPPDSLQILIERIAKIFPQCKDQIEKSQTKKFIPHFSIARFKNQSEAENFIRETEKTWKPLEFTLKEIYMLFHPEELKHPFELFEAIPLGSGSLTPPHYGLNSPLNDEKCRSSRSVVVCGIPTHLQTDFQLTGLFSDKQIKPIRAEINRNPDGKSRDCGVVEFTSKAEAQTVVASYKFSSYPTIYLKLLAIMFWPSVVGGACSLKPDLLESES